ncbi:class I SAM-dependent methyltransferase [Aggregicoccus sp. 17bor-14]|uniref:class I SAM-dependent methyltransferase n=1 Tax=Myxococcaceae TaxID=31 RepID=UPI00129C677A|nr:MULTISPECIES: class I SAM-dependent methyltransferase [Myxococcaceae]MBF5042259.1 class I SAM-dependent methyltransferase [Simulacricoccus sp. 17bor-14]MRI88034.1 class I SAM-dependent methyltransferase [Aggregicoccus sp. 17bor-14]
MQLLPFLEPSAAAPAARAYQASVNAQFAQEAGYWKGVYAQQSLAGLIYQLRHATALAWIDALALPPLSAVLEIGCGAALMSVALARRGHRVACIDASAEMVRQACTGVQEAGVSDRVTVHEGDAHALRFAAGSQRLVVALGVLPWLYSPALALAEMVRVLRPGGYVLLSSDNRLRLDHLLDPRRTPALAPARRLLRPLARALGVRRPAGLASLMTYRKLTRLLRGAGLEPLRHRTFGFGPFSLLGRPLLPGPLGIRLHQRLQALADRGVPVLRATGAQDLVLAHRV